MRIAISISAAFFVTLALFYLMQFMIKGSDKDIKKPENYQVVDFVRLQPELEEASSQPLKRTRPPKPRRQPGMPAASETKLAALEPPKIIPQGTPAQEPIVPMQLGKPYLGAQTAALPNSAVPNNLSSQNEIKASSKPTPKRITGVESSSLAKATSVDGLLPHSNPRSQGNQSQVRGTNTSSGTIPGRLGDVGEYTTGEAIPVFKMQPKYPRKAAKSRIEGWVKVEFTITEKGTVKDAVVVDSRPRRTFDRSAVQSIRKWRFNPKLVDGRPVPRKASQIIQFKLSKS